MLLLLRLRLLPSQRLLDVLLLLLLLSSKVPPRRII